MISNQSHKGHEDLIIISGGIRILFRKIFNFF